MKYWTLLILAIALTQFGCNRGAGRELVLVIDYSGSTSALRSQQQAVVTSSLEAAGASSGFCLYRMGSSTEELTAGTIESTPIEAIVSTLKRATDASDNQRGTNFALMAEAVLARLRATDAAMFEITVMTDGADDFAGDRAIAARYAKAVGQICQDRRVVSVTFVGVLPRNRRAIRLAWTAAGSRLQLMDPIQATDR